MENQGTDPDKPDITIIEQFLKAKSNSTNDTIKDLNSLLTGFNSFESSANTKQRIAGHLNLIRRYSELVAEDHKANKETSRDYNLFRLIKLKETTHSFLLAHLLNPLTSHGQENHFLLHFLRKLDIKEPEKGEWVVTAEKGRVDILIKRHHPHSVIVIENKSNDAGDQLNQLYRYWYRQIYLPKKVLGFHYAQEHPEYYRMIYLSSRKDKAPSPHSITRPEKWQENLPITIPLDVLQWTFKEEIVNWLEQALMDIVHKQNHRLRENIKQYIELWK